MGSEMCIRDRNKIIARSFSQHRVTYQLNKFLQIMKQMSLDSFYHYYCHDDLIYTLAMILIKQLSSLTIVLLEILEVSLNPLSANGELSRHENLTFLWTWILRWVPRSFATHASLCNTLSSNKLCPKTVKILELKGLIHP